MKDSCWFQSLKQRTPSSDTGETVPDDRLAMGQPQAELFGYCSGIRQTVVDEDTPELQPVHCMSSYRDAT